MALQLSPLDQRKAAIVALTPQSGAAAEIGADHGIISAHLLDAGVCGHMIVSDISAASLEKAKRLFARHGLTPRASFRVADGLAALEEPVDAAILAGMGAETIIEILSNGQSCLGEAALVLQANSRVALLRQWLMLAGYRVDDERLVRDGRRFYIALRALRGQRIYTIKELELGPCLLQTKPADWKDYLMWRRDCALQMGSRGNNRLITWLEEEIRAL